MSGGIVHPAGCRCPGCLPAQYVMRPAASPRLRQPSTAYRRPRHPAQRSSGGGVGILLPAFLIFFAVAVVGFWPAMVWHGEGGPTGTAWKWNIQSTIAELVYWGFILVCAAGWKLTKTERWARWSEAANTAPAAPQAPPICVHRNKVEVNNGYLEQMGIKKLEAWWCPDCETRLDADWKPPPPAISVPAQAAAPGAGWTWRWWCTCGKDRSGWAATELTAQDAINTGVAAHQGTGHRWQSQWRKRD